MQNRGFWHARELQIMALLLAFDANSLPNKTESFSRNRKYYRKNREFHLPKLKSTPDEVFDRTGTVDAVMRRAIPILACIEKAIYPRLATPQEATKRFVGLAIFILTLRLLLAPFPLSNILPAVLIAFISLAYLERDGLLLIVALLAGCLLLILDLGVFWQLTQDAKWITGFI